MPVAPAGSDGGLILDDSLPTSHTRFVVLVPDSLEAQSISEGLGSWGLSHGQGCRVCSVQRPSPLQVCAASRMAQLVGMDLEPVDLLIAAATLEDGNAVEVTAYTRGIRPDLPILFVGDADDSPLMLEAIHAGALDFVVREEEYLARLPLKVEKCLALGRIKRENNRLQRELAESLTELAEKHRQLQAAVGQLEATARTDELTGLCNRRSLKESLDSAWASSLRHSQPLAFLMIDLDGFKIINDQHGHHRGDELLQLTSKVIQANSRQVDLPARYGGDEFCVMMPSTEAHEAVRVAKRILREFDHAIAHVEPWATGVGMSIGIAHSDLGRPASAEQLIRQADEALYAAKKAGKRCLMIAEGQGMYSPVAME